MIFKHVQSQGILSDACYIWMRFGTRFYQFRELVHDANEGLKMFGKVGGATVRVLVRHVGASLLLKVNAQHCPADGTVKFPVRKPCVCCFLVWDPAQT